MKTKTKPNGEQLTVEIGPHLEQLLRDIFTEAAAETEPDANQLHAEILGAAKTTLEKALQIGAILTKQKRKLAHGEWMPWLKANVKFSQGTANNYMRVYTHHEQTKGASNLSEAYQLLPKRGDGS
jgi:hypothetical protein